jgi:hypothetical protein
MSREHDDDMNAEVGEGARGEADQFAVVQEDLEDRDAEAEQGRLAEMQRNLEKGEENEGDEE